MVNMVNFMIREFYLNKNMHLLGNEDTNHRSCKACHVGCYRIIAAEDRCKGWGWRGKKKAANLVTLPIPTS